MKKYRINNHIVYNKLDKEIVIVSTKRALISSLNESGTEIFNLLCEQAKTIEELTEFMLNNYEIQKDKAEADIKELIKKLIENELVIEIND